MNKGEFFLPDCLELGYCFSHAFVLELKYHFFLGLEPDDFWTETTPLALLSFQLADCWS